MTTAHGVASSRCPRRGRYRMPTLVATYGADAPMTDVLRALSVDCPRRAPETRLTELCGIHCPQMPSVF